MKHKNNLQKILYFILLLSLVTCAVPQKSSTRTPANSQLFEQLTANALSQLPIRYQNQLETLQGNMAKFMLFAANKSDKEKIKIFNEARIYFNKVATPLLENIESQIKGQDAIHSFEIIPAPQWTLNSEINFLLDEVKKLPEGKDGMRLNQLLNISSEFLPSIVGQLPDTNIENKEDLSDFLKALSDTNGNNDDRALLLINKFEEKFDIYFNKIKHVGKFLSESGEISFPSKTLETFVKSFLDFYYNNINEDILKNIISDILSLKKHPTNIEVAQVMFKNSGPGLGKTLQQLAKEPGMGESIKKLMEMLESKGKQVPYHLVKKIVQQDTGGYTFLKIDNRPVGTGTIAQVHRAIIDHQGHQQIVALRFLKPQINERAQADLKILELFLEEFKQLDAFKKVPNISKVISGIKDFLLLDLDIEGTIKRQIMAKKYYEKSVKEIIDNNKRTVTFNVPKVYLPENGHKTNLHIQEFLSDGMKFSKLANKDKASAQFASQAIMRLWFEQALFKDGFMHADLHQGNFKVAVLEDSKNIRVAIFDYGMAELLEKDIQRAFILLGAGSTYNDPKIISKALAGIIINFPNDKNALNKLTNEINKEISSQNKSLKPVDWIKFIVKEGHQLPDQLGTLARGGALVTQLPKIVGQKTLSKQIAIELAKKNILRSIIDWNYDFPLNISDLKQLGIKQIKKSCVNIINKFFK